MLLFKFTNIITESLTFVNVFRIENRDRAHSFLSFVRKFYILIVGII